MAPKPLLEAPGPGERAVVQRRQKLGAGGRVLQQVAQRLLLGQGVEQLLIVQRRFEKRLPLQRGERSGGVSAQQFPDVFGPHRFPGSQSPPISSRRCFRQRWSQV